MPPAYFGIYSYSIAQTALYVPDGHFSHPDRRQHQNLDDWQRRRLLPARTSRPAGRTAGRR